MLELYAILVSVYLVYFAYNVLYLVPKYGVMFFKLPGYDRVWRISSNYPQEMTTEDESEFIDDGEY